MSSSRLPRLERGVVVDAETARQDRVMLEVGNWTFDGDDSDVSMVLNHLSEHFSVRGIDRGQIHHPVFGAPQGRGWPKTVSLRKQPSDGPRRAGVPLFGGHLLIRRLRAEGDQSQFQMSFHLALNPTRFVAHQVSRRELVSGDATVRTVQPVSLLSRVLSSQTEFSLHDDNVLIGVRSAVMARPELWPLWLESYLTAILAALHDTMQSAFSRAISAPLRFTQHYSVTEVENYWEFQCADPVHEVHRLAPPVTAYGAWSDRRLFRNLLATAETDSNSLVLRVSAGAGRRLTVYAKGTRRIRLEVRQVLADVPRFGPHTTGQAPDVISMLLRTADLGATDVNQFLRHLDGALFTDVEQATAYALVAAVIGAAPQPHVHAPLLSILVNVGAVTLSPRSPFRAAVQSLRRSNDVERTRDRGQTFRLAAKYRDAQRVLQAMPETL